MSIGQRISKLRKDKGYSQEYIAEKLGVSRQAVSKWETDASAPDTYNLISLAELFDVSVEYIATGHEPNPYPQAREEETKKSGITTQKILGIVLIGVGLLSLILGLLLSEALIILSVVILIGGVICLTSRKGTGLIARPGLIATWVYWIVSFFMLSMLTRQNIFIIFDPAVYESGITTFGMIISYVFWIWLIINIAVTSVLMIKQITKRRLK